MTNLHRALVIQTAFLGDLILTLPLIQVLKRTHPELLIDVVVRADAAAVLRNHPDISKVIAYDKRGRDSGIGGFAKLTGTLNRGAYDVAIVPHRSLRSAALAWGARIPLRIGFDRSAGRILLTSVVEYRAEQHEFRRNLNLLEGLGEKWAETEYPRLYPSIEDVNYISMLLDQHGISTGKLIAIAPGTLWNTKRWLPERFAAVGKSLHAMGFNIVLIGGPSDAPLCESIAEMGGDGLVSTAGKCSPLQSAELIKRSRVLLTNDSAPLHMGVAVGTPVAAIFGATTPSIGFSPYGPRDIVIENTELTCRPCAIHGGNTCPIQTFVCMKRITEEAVAERLLEMISHS